MFLVFVFSPSPRRDRHRSKSPRRHRSRSRDRRHRSKSPGTAEGKAGRAQAGNGGLRTGAGWRTAPPPASRGRCSPSAPLGLGLTLILVSDQVITEATDIGATPKLQRGQTVSIFDHLELRFPLCASAVLRREGQPFFFPLSTFHMFR